MTVVEQDWKQRAGELADAGVSQRQIAEELGVPRSSVGDFLRARSGAPAEPESNGHGADLVAEIEAQAGPGEAITPIDGQRDIYNREHAAAVYVEEIRVDGTTQVAIDFGGKVAQSGTLALSGSAVVEGFYRKGDRIRGSFEAVIVAVTGKDKVDKQTGIVTEAGQSHAARITDMRVGG